METFEPDPFAIPDEPYAQDDIAPFLLSDELPSYRVAVFVTDVMAWFEALVAAQYVLFYQEMRAPLRQALDEVRGTHESVISRLQSRDSLGPLREAGLADASLLMKFTGYLEARRRFLRRGGIKRLKTMLKWINTILGSLAAALPSAHPLVEMKEAIERVVEDTVEM